MPLHMTSIPWRVLWLFPAIALFMMAFYEASQHRAVENRIAKSRIPPELVPPTVHTEHSGKVVAFVCLGVGCVILAFRKHVGSAEEPAK
jgi:hypothetical protein